MSISRSGHIVVATSGSAASQSAITYAAREADDRGLALEVVHVVTPSVPVAPYGPGPDVELRHAGKELLARGEHLAAEVAPHLDVTTTLLTGSRPDAIVHHAEGAELLVIGALQHDLFGRLWSGSTVMGIAARATCPVIIVPEGGPRTPTRQVLVGLKSTRHAERLLATAFAVASQTRSELRIVHAWHLMSPYDEAIAERLPAPAWEIEEGRAIDGLLIDLRMAYPDVQVEVDVVHGQPGHTLAEASRDADLLVISRPVHGGFVHHLGATARAAIRESACPVLVVPPVDHDRQDEHAPQQSALAP
jgi:nucleotide-binding universal stress UspA family protein